MRKILFVLFLLINFKTVSAQLDKKYESVVLEFIDNVKNQNREKLATKIKFPLKRDYPIPSIKNKQEFLKRYNEVFDNDLSKKITVSIIPTDWHDVGWRGIMLLNGAIWLNDDGILITVNHQSEFEKKEKARLIALEKQTLHSSIKTFKQPILIFETSNFRIRIDDLGDSNYRYISWSVKNKMSEKPSLIIKNGNWNSEGSGGNHNYEFKNGDYLYTCYINVIGETQSPPAMLTISKGRKEILKQKAKKIIQ
ncbi:hypothetical protein [Pedobacter aquatilis]|uniref:hypothetical protein n=1 Tax=Pedobacter aquatilis TaxID=351343 RepID=UPI00292DB200|nr:hypothetical protein [Pedobacter aquatilis]